MSTCLLFTWQFLLGQQIDQVVLATSGNTTENSGISLQWTLGEVAVSNYDANDLFLTEGFNQDLFEDVNTSTEEFSALYEMVVFPNPTSFNIELKSDIIYTFDYQVVNVDGKVLANGILKTGEFINTSFLPGGIYILKLRDEKGKSAAYSFIKLQ